MFVRSIAAVVAIGLFAGALAPSPVQALSYADLPVARAAFSAVDRRDWSQARQVAAGANDPVVGKLVLWSELTNGASGRSFTEIAGFIAENPDWPMQNTLRQRAEEAMPAMLDPGPVAAWFDRFPPVTLRGWQSYAEALFALGDTARATEMARKGWVEADGMPGDDEVFFASLGGFLTTEDNARRVDRLIWDGKLAAADRMLTRLDGETAAVTLARLALRRGDDGAFAYVAAVPETRRGDPGLVYDQVRWYRKGNNEGAAGELLATHPIDAARPELVVSERAAVVRKLIAQGNIDLAYQAARGHGLSAGGEFADVEWLAGWTALRFINTPDVALRHFQAGYDNAQTPGGKARLAYWAGRAAEAMGDGGQARQWYDAARRHPTTYYGQLAAAGGGTEAEIVLPADPVPNAREATAFGQDELVGAIETLAALGRTDQLKAFLLRLADNRDSPGWKDLAAALAHRVQRPDVAVAIARKTIRDQGQPLIRNGYPTIAVPDAGRFLETPVVLAITRQESGFDPRAVSSANAQGLMQLLPSTARNVASANGLPVGLSLFNADYNMTLGKSFLASLLDKYEGSYVLAFAAYNAGPGRASTWIDIFGDPRRGPEYAIDWVEMIPFTETRNYVQRVIENLNVYRAKQNGMRASLGAADSWIR